MTWMSRLRRVSAGGAAPVADGDRAFARLVAGQAVVLAGPARTLEGTGAGAAIDRFDLVVRVNEGLWHAQAGADVHRDYGARTDICYGNQAVLRSAVLDQAPTWRQRPRHVLPHLVCTNNSLSYGADGRPSAACPWDDRRVPGEVAAGLHRASPGRQCRVAWAAPALLHRWLDGQWARTGLVALVDLLMLEVASLHVTGMTFYHGGGHRLAPRDAVLGPRTNRDGTPACDGRGIGHDSVRELDILRWLLRWYPARLSVDAGLERLLR